jgi:ABC-type transport system involved in cytochrome c biogenesis permease subunit
VPLCDKISAAVAARLHAEQACGLHHGHRADIMAFAMGFLEKVSIFCFAASYGVALALELAHLLSPRPVLRYLGVGFGVAGLLAQLIYLLVQPLSLASPSGSLLFLTLILVVFYIYGTVHHHRLAWGLFVLPLILGLIGLAVMLRDVSRDAEGRWTHLWGLAHGVFLLLAAVGVCVGFLASVMYLVQLRRLRAKAPPGQGMKLMSLERLEDMNRRAILWSFPLLTAGLLIGVALQIQRGDFGEGWDSAKILSGVGLWIVFAILLYLRYGAPARGRQVALLTMLAFAVLIFVLVSPIHPFLQGGAP